MSIQYIIDGYNITNHPKFTNQLPRGSLDSRSLLVQLIKKKRLCGSYRNIAWVVFDGYPDTNMESFGDNNIKVIFSRRESADSRIKKIIELVSNPKNLIVVSDDKEISFFIKSCGARPMSVEEFLVAKDKVADKFGNLAEEGLTHAQMRKINDELKKLWLS